MFMCSQCGECCKNLHESPIYNDLHNGDGICRYLVDDRCSIYENRPLLCRIDESYPVFFKDTMSYEDYLQLNYNACDALQKKKER